jgi:hypothetical protein
MHYPYLYFISPSPIKKDSAKIPHFLKIVEFYKSLLKYEKPKTLIVEPKYGKEYMEPDAFMIWRSGVFFVEIQRFIYFEKVMKEKINRYESYYLSNKWQGELWQPHSRKVFPAVIVITEVRYRIQSSNIKFFQVQHIDQLMNLFKPKQEPIKIKIN